MAAHASVAWFVVIAGCSAALWVLGSRIGRGPARLARWVIAGGVATILGWGWLIHHPAAAVRVIPVSLLSRIEGVGGVPIFMLVLGVAWARCQRPRQRVVVGWAMTLGTIYFIHGGAWMLQTTPSTVMGQTVHPHVTRQTQDYSCVPAACATALNLLGFPSTEAQMAELTQTRPGTGSTMIRAVGGLDRRLRHAAFRPVLLDTPAAELDTLPLPALTPLQFEPTRLHMVVISRVTPDGVWIMDPTDGYLFLTNHQFEHVYRRQVIAFAQNN
ncbi:MAG: cysteine peptidase family C39 domain-containing protein [Planctomycetota bacterium]